MGWEFTGHSDVIKFIGIIINSNTNLIIIELLLYFLCGLCRTLMASESVDSSVFLKVAHNFWGWFCEFPDGVSADDVRFVQSLLAHMVSYSTAGEFNKSFLLVGF